MASESKSTGLLKIVSALFLIWAVANILVMLGINSCAGIEDLRSRACCRSAESPM